MAKAVLSPPPAQGAMDGGDNANIRYFTDGNWTDWVCGDAGINNQRGCGFAGNWNSTFPCKQCKKLKPGHRKDKVGIIYQHNSYTCGCKAQGPDDAHFNNWANKDVGCEPYCKHCGVQVGQFDEECGYNRGYMPDGRLYWGIHEGVQRFKEDGKGPLKRKGTGVLRGDVL